MVQTNPEIEIIVANATNVASSKNHEYVTLEHLLQAMVSSEEFGSFLANFGADVELMQTDIDVYLDKQTYLVSKVYDIVPKKTHSLERVFNRAYTQVLFSGRQSLQSIDLLLSIMTETKSYASYITFKYGLDRHKLVNLWNKSYSTVKTKQKRSKADDILEEYCENLNELAMAGEIDPVIGREFEIDEIAQVLAKRNKSNVLMVGDPGVGKTAIAEALSSYAR